MGDSRSDEIRSAEQVRPLRFTLRQVECFLAVAEAGSISRAASRLSASRVFCGRRYFRYGTLAGCKAFSASTVSGVTLTSDGKTALPLHKAYSRTVRNYRRHWQRKLEPWLGLSGLAVLAHWRGLILPAFCHCGRNPAGHTY